MSKNNSLEGSSATNSHETNENEDIQIPSLT